MKLKGDVAGPKTRANFHALEEGSERVGVLAERVAVRVLEMSPSGCLLESGFQIPVGTVGRLRLKINGRLCSEDIRVSRCQRIEGAGSRHRIGAEFLLTRRPGRASLRMAVGTDRGPLGAPPLGQTVAVAAAFEIRGDVDLPSGGA